jgi:hypothetical protein
MQLGSRAGLILRGCVLIRMWVGEEKGISEEVQSLIDTLNLYMWILERIDFGHEDEHGWRRVAVVALGV